MNLNARTKSKALADYSKGFEFSDSFFLFLQFILKHFPELLHFRFDHILAISLLAVVIVIGLVIIFRFVKNRERADLRYHRFSPGIFDIHFILVILRFLLLLFVMIKNHRAVLRSFIISLAIQLRWIMTLPESRKQFIKRNFCGIVNDVADFGMTGGAGADFAISRIFHRASAETGSN